MRILSVRSLPEIFRMQIKKNTHNKQTIYSLQKLFFVQCHGFALSLLDSFLLKFLHGVHLASRPALTCTNLNIEKHELQELKNKVSYFPYRLAYGNLHLLVSSARRIPWNLNLLPAHVYPSYTSCHNVSFRKNKHRALTSPNPPLPRTR